MTDFSYQLYSSRNFPPLADTLRMLADLGYAQVEGYGALYADPSSLGVLEKGLADTGLAMPTGHVSLDMCRDDPKRVLEIAKALDMKGVIVPFIMPDQRPKDAAGWANFGADLAKIGKVYQDAGLFFGYHNHDFEMVPLAGGELPLDILLAADDSLMLEFDVAWSVRGNYDPLKVIARHGRRLKAAHVKDIAPAGQNAKEDGWADVGHGTMDWPALMNALRKVGCTYFVMEHDNPSDHRRFASRALAAAKAM
jgi:sugar phosphate isomerase/epimerase